MVFSDYVKQRILFYHRSRKSFADIVCCLTKEGYRVSKSGVFKFIRRYKESSTIARAPGTGQASKATPSIYL